MKAAPTIIPGVNHRKIFFIDKIFGVKIKNIFRDQQIFTENYKIPGFNYSNKRFSFRIIKANLYL